jgi:predicted CXXCH cytochrome family protein
MRWIQTHRKSLLTLLAVAILAVIAISCATVERTVVVPPEIPGATFVGSESCAQCHENITRDFHSASHARLRAPGPNAANVGCESCHGPGSIHNESGGARHTIINPNKSPEACFQCHLEMKARFSLPYHHPVPEGKMTCSDCHNPHKGPAIIAGGTSLLAENETCFKCHTVQRGPFVYEHEASREGCLTCHQPHGSINQRMLVERNATLCFKCHFQQQTVTGQIVIGGRDHAGSLARGTCWSAGCHEAVHGSQVNSSLRF